MVDESFVPAIQRIKLKIVGFLDSSLVSGFVARRRVQGKKFRYMYILSFPMHLKT